MTKQGRREFIDDLPSDQAQPYEVVPQHEFISIRQWDGTGEFEHWVLIPKSDLETFINTLREAIQ